MILEVCWDGLWTLSFGLSQFHGHSSWLVCVVALTVFPVIHSMDSSILTVAVYYSISMSEIWCEIYWTLGTYMLTIGFGALFTLKWVTFHVL